VGDAAATEPPVSEPAREPSTAPAPADEAPAPPPAAAPSSLQLAEPWLEPGNEGFDWVLVESHEWLKGSVKAMREGDITFGSSQFGDLVFPWGKIKVLRTAGEYVLVDKGNDTHRGKVMLRDGKLVLTAEDGAETALEQGQILSVVGLSKREIENWDFAAMFGATLRQGNTESVDYSAYLRLRREDAFNRARLQYDGAFGEVAGVVNTNKHRGQANWDLFVSPVFYLTPLIGDIQFDEFQNLDVRWTAGAGAGAHVYNKSGIKLDLELAGGYTQTNYISVEAGAPDRRDDGLVRPRAYFDWKITGDIEWELDWATSIVANDVQYTFHHGETRFSVDLTDVFSLMYSVIYDRQETPVTDVDGNTPVRDDVAMALSVGVDLD
jgi:hypothetical protein